MSFDLGIFYTAKKRQSVSNQAIENGTPPPLPPRSLSNQAIENDTPTLLPQRLVSNQAIENE